MAGVIVHGAYMVPDQYKPTSIAEAIGSPFRKGRGPSTRGVGMFDSRSLRGRDERGTVERHSTHTEGVIERVSKVVGESTGETIQSKKLIENSTLFENRELVETIASSTTELERRHRERIFFQTLTESYGYNVTVERKILQNYAPLSNSALRRR